MPARDCPKAPRYQRERLGKAIFGWGIVVQTILVLFGLTRALTPTLKFLGLFLGLASASLAERLGFLSRVPMWIWWILPASYMASDLAEDAGLPATKSWIRLTPASFRLLSNLTALKLATVTMAIARSAFLGPLNLLLLFPPGRPV
jgi:hypothetical protein